VVPRRSRLAEADPIDDDDVDGGSLERPASHLGRPRAADRTPAILAAAKELVEEIGYDRLRIQDVADRAGVGLATLYRRWPTKQALMADTLRYKAQTVFPPELDDPVADLLSLYRVLLDGLCGEKGEMYPGFLVALRAEPELAEVFRQEVLAPLRQRARASLARIVGVDCPQLDLLVDLAPSVLTFRRVMLGEEIDTEAFLRDVISLVTSCSSPAPRDPLVDP
jgi:AcrR family transcriptional regulator